MPSLLRIFAAASDRQIRFAYNIIFVDHTEILFVTLMLTIFRSYETCGGGFKDELALRFFHSVFFQVPKQRWEIIPSYCSIRESVRNIC